MRAPPASIRVDLPGRGYNILIGSGLIDAASSYGDLLPGGQAVVVTNDAVGPLYAARVAHALRSAGQRVETIVQPDGEAYKLWPAVQRILDEMVRLKCDRDTVVYALGGGVVGDVAGFAAACYMRGVAYVQIPTTLLAQVDSSVGGKTGINHAEGKNLIGAFHQPGRVVIDLDVLRTLPERELVAGLAEVIKYGAACDAGFLDWIEANLQALRQKEPSALAEAIGRSCAIKAGIVASDERESGRRAILNFGHTFAHAIETGSGHGRWLHGEAVGCGMVLASDLSARLGRLDPSFVERMASIVRSAGLPVEAPPLGTERYLELMRLDKKGKGGRLRFVLLDGPGRAVVAAVEPEPVARTLEARTGRPERP